jgi:hypothetical protein
VVGARENFSNLPPKTPTEEAGNFGVFKTGRKGKNLKAWVYGQALEEGTARYRTTLWHCGITVDHTPYLLWLLTSTTHKAIGKCLYFA